jgi:hypothetical protein
MVLAYQWYGTCVRIEIRTRVRTNITLSQKHLEIQALRYAHVYVRTYIVVAIPAVDLAIEAVV